MNKKLIGYFIFSSLFAFIVYIGSLIQTVKAEEQDVYVQQKLNSHLLINLFLERVDQGDLTLFGHVLKRSDLQSHQVSYVHNIIDDTLLMRLCFILKKRILVPDYESFYVEMISVEINKDGDYMELTSHVSQIEESSSGENKTEKEE